MASQLIDKLLVNPGIDKEIQNALLNCGLVIRADNVADYVSLLHEKPKHKTYSDEIASMGIFATPFKRMFVQFRHPEAVKGLIPEIGVAVYRDEVESDAATNPDKTFGAGGSDCATKWQITGYAYSTDSIAQIVQIGVFRFLVSHEGRYIEGRNSYGISGYANPQTSQLEEMRNDILAFLERITLWTLAFMNCKNAVLEAVEPNAAENKRRAKHGKLPLMRYHVLKINPFGGRSDNEAQGGTHDSPALHIRRGHFATYTDDAPLFGKYVGTYWKDQTLVGRKSNHVVVKDYEIDLTAQESGVT